MIFPFQCCWRSAIKKLLHSTETPSLWTTSSSRNDGWLRVQSYHSMICQLNALEHCWLSNGVQFLAHINQVHHSSLKLSFWFIVRFFLQMGRTETHELKIKPIVLFPLPLYHSIRFFPFSLRCFFKHLHHFINHRDQWRRYISHVNVNAL